MKNWKIFLLISFLSLTGAAWAGVTIVYKLANLNFKLYKENQPGGEKYWGGSKAAELASFIEGGLRVRKAQLKIAHSDFKIGDTNYGEQGVGRVFHRRSHGCVTGKLNLILDRPLDPAGKTSVGMFDPRRKQSYDVLVRFSNGVGLDQGDKLPDVRGAAIKVLDVYNSATGKYQTVDLLMTNSPTPFGKDFLEFADFMDFVADAGPTIGGLLFATHPRADWKLLKTTGLPIVSNYKIKSVATIRYWGGHPYLLGPDLAMKFNIAPTETNEHTVETLKTDFSIGSDYYVKFGDYLEYDLRERLRDHPVKFVFSIQLEKNPIETPIEDNLTEWKESVSQSIPVAELVLDQQDFSSREFVHAETCEPFRFTPAHYIPEHRPLSNMGRGRLFGYEASQIGRQASEVEPTPELIDQWRKDEAVR